MPEIRLAYPHDEPAVFNDLGTENGSALVATFKVVVVRGVDKQWAAYFGPYMWTDSQVSNEGNKLPREAAQRMFPYIAGPYRE